MPEFAAPGVGRERTKVEIDIEIGLTMPMAWSMRSAEPAEALLRLLHGWTPCLRYNMMIIEQYTAQSAEPIAPGKHKIEVVTEIAGPGQGGTATLFVDGKEVGKAELKRNSSCRLLGH